MHVVIQLAGSIAILVPFVLVQLKRIAPAGRLYLLANLVGSGVLAVDAAVEAQWGFLLLEGVWAVVSGVGLIRARSTHAPPAAPAASPRRRAARPTSPR
jgi:hypothetical protein